MKDLFFSTLPPLPLLLWETPPGLELVLAQEGVPHIRVRDAHPLAFRGGRFVLYDGRQVSRAMLRSTLAPDHVALDIDALREEEDDDPFELLVDDRPARLSWPAAGRLLTERVARVNKGAIRHRILTRIRNAVAQAGGMWARLAAFPYPYRSAFNFRVDLDEPFPEDYARFAKARRPLADCCTHFVSTQAYGDQPKVLEDLLRFDTQSHGHYHVVYRDVDANRKNLERAKAVLEDAGFRADGFAGPHGAWNPGIDGVLEDLGCRYSSDFQLGYDDLPFFPWRDGRFSKVLQVPIHPVCEGLFLEAGIGSGEVMAEYFANVVRAKVAAGEPAFVYGHPERRLSRFPEILATLASVVASESLVWRTTLTEFAEWWRWRNSRTWQVLPRQAGRFEVQFDEWDEGYPMGLEIVRGAHVSTVPISGPRMPLRLQDLAYERRETPAALPQPVPASGSRGLRAAVRDALDWETVTPVEELPHRTIPDRVKRRLRQWREQRSEKAAS